MFVCRRELLNNINMNDNINVAEINGSVWVLCHSRDAPDIYMLQMEYNDKSHSNAIVKFMVI